MIKGIILNKSWQRWWLYSASGAWRIYVYFRNIGMFFLILHCIKIFKAYGYGWFYYVIEYCGIITFTFVLFQSFYLIKFQIKPKFVLLKWS